MPADAADPQAEEACSTFLRAVLVQLEAGPDATAQHTQVCLGLRGRLHCLGAFMHPCSSMWGLHATALQAQVGPAGEGTGGGGDASACIGWEGCKAHTPSRTEGCCLQSVPVSTAAKGLPDSSK